MAEPDQPDERLRRLIDVIALASVGEYASACERFGEVTPDAFGMLEESLRIFVAELSGMDAARHAALAEMSEAKGQLEAKLALIEEQQQAIRELSSPVLDIWEDVVAVPLVGRIDRGGALALTEKLLAAVVARRARWALLDVTGVDAIDTETAECLSGLTRAVGLVGARCVLTGVTPSAATSLVEHAGELRGVKCLANLREGLRHCLVQRRGR